MFALALAASALSCGHHHPEPDFVPATLSGSDTLATETLQGDRDQSSVAFSVSSAQLDHVGRFEDFRARLALDGDRPTELEIVVETGSVIADHADLTAHLRGADFFDSEHFPVATFTATSLEPVPGEPAGTYRVTGPMVFHGVERELDFPATITIGPDVVRCQASVAIHASDFDLRLAGMDADVLFDAVGLEVDLTFLRTPVD